MNKELFSNLKNLSERIEKLKGQTNTEEATKMSFIIPFFQILGYDVFNPLEFVPEYTQDVGTKKGEKVDYAIMQNNSPIILIEAKACNVNLNNKHINQLFRYFTVSKARFAILTNGIIYKFYSDLDEPNKMDIIPFLEIDMTSLKEKSVTKLESFCKDDFNIKNILDNASELKYSAMIRKALEEQIEDPSDQFIKALIKDVYNGVKTQTVIDRFRSIVKECFTEYINDTLNQRLKTVMNPPEPSVKKPEEKLLTNEETIILEYIKTMISKVSGNIIFKKTDNYASVQIGNNNRKWVCRLYYKKPESTLIFHKFPIPEFGDYETDYFFSDPKQLEQIKELFIGVAEYCVKS